MKKYTLDLTEYEVDFERWVIKDEKRELEKGTEPFPLKDELSMILRIPGIFENGVAVFDACLLGKQIKNCEEDSLEISEEELKLLKTAMNKLIAREHNPATGLIALGGPRYEEMIIRVFGLDRD